MRSPRLRRLCLPLLALLAACSASWYEQKAEEDAGALLEERTRDFERERRTTLVEPASVPLDEPDPAEELPPPEISGPLSLHDALRIATLRNREYLTQRESLEIAALGVLGVRFQFQPQFSSSLAYRLTDTSSLERSQRATFDLGVSQVLPTGGDLSVTGTTNAVRNENFPDVGIDFSSAVTARLTQPLLRGAGYEVRYESLTQAERDLVYSIRAFELFRQDFTIRIVSRFFDLVEQQARIENSRVNLEQSEILRDRSQRFFAVGRTSEIEKLRAENDYLRSEDRLKSEVENYGLLLDRFKIDLGLPVEIDLEVVLEKPDFLPLDITLRQAVEAALANRLDLRTSYERLEDTERGVRIARQNLLPDLDISANYRHAWLPDRAFLRQENGETSYDVGISLEIPLQRVQERNAYRRSLIDLGRRQREVALDEDEIILEVRDRLRTLETTASRLLIQEKNLVSEEKRFLIAERRFREGKIDNREIVEAQTSLLNVKNTLVELKNDYAITRLRLLRTIGTLFLDENGVPIR